MLFNLEGDIGSEIQGYLVPDGFSDQPKIRIIAEGRDDIVMDCDGMRDAVVASGRHATGLIGFHLDDTKIPGIAEMKRLAIYDAKTGLLVYRRSPSETIIHKRVLRLETQLIPFLQLDRALDPYFQYSIRSIERFGHETAMQAFHLNAVDSIYISGRLLLRNYEEFLEKGFEVVAHIVDPYVELAERLILLKRFDKLPPALIGDRDRMIFSPAAEYFAEVDVFSPKQLKRALSAIPEKVQRCLTSPLTRQLVSTHPENIPTRQSIAGAMDLLSRFAIVGLKSDPDTFIRPLAEYLEIDDNLLVDPPRAGMASELAETLRSQPETERLVELDIILYHFAHAAIALHNGVGT